MEKKTVSALEQHREDVAEERETWKTAQPDMDVKSLVFIDEPAVEAFAQPSA